MSKAATTELERRVTEASIVDLDFHLHVPIEKLYPYVADDDIRKELEEFGPPPGTSNGLTPKYASEVYRSAPHDRPQGVAVDAVEIAEVMEDHATDVAVVTPGTHLQFTSMQYTEIKHALFRAYNDYVLDNVIDVDAGIVASMALPIESPEVAVEELRRVGSESGFVGAQHEVGLSELLGGAAFDPVYSELVDLDLPFFLHVANPSANRYDLVNDSMESFVETMMTNVSYGAIANTMSMIMTGVFDKFPDLDVLVQEAGQQWLPYVANRSDEVYQVWTEDLKLTERFREMEQDYLQRMPSEYVRDNFYVTTQPIALPGDPTKVEAMFELCDAEDTFVFATDWPHSSLDLPTWVFETSAIDAELRDAILQGNAREFLRLPETLR